MKHTLAAFLGGLIVAAIIIGTALLSPADQSARPALPTPSPAPAPVAPR